MNCRLLGLGIVGSSILVASVTAAPIILNEYNAVSSGRYLDANEYSDSADRGDAYFATFPGVTNGRIQGNGGNWFELIVVEDHVDMRGWKLQWAEQGSTSGTRNIWTGNAMVDQGEISVGNADIWSDLRSGTIITVSELESIPVDTTVRSGNQNFTVPEDSDMTFETTINLASDTSYDPAGGDWWIHASTLDELDSATPLLTSETNVEGDMAGNFSVGNDDWQLRIVDGAGTVVFGPAGEGVGPLSNVSSREVAKLEENPTPAISAASNYNDGTSSTFGAPNLWSSATMTQDFSALRSVVGNGGGGDVQLQAGDSNQDLAFDQLDIVKVQIAAKYLTGQAASWGDGDWNGAPGGSVGNPPAGDGLFNQLDIVAAQQNGLYLTGPYGAVSPGGVAGDGQTSVSYDPATGEVGVDAPAGVELTSINIDSAGGIFTGAAAQNLGGSFDNDADGNIFKATFGGSFGSLTFGNVAQTGLSQDVVLNDLTVVGSLAGGGALGDVDLIYVPEPCTAIMLVIATAGLLGFRQRRQ